ncbi:MAG: 7TM diverse intracellular signaling domain-containing protein [Bacteroidales bacterium]
MRFKFLLLIFSIGFIASSHANTQETFSAHNGTIELSGSTFLQNNILKLRGDCEFYWNQLLEPKDFNDSTVKRTPQYVKIPKSWTTYKIDDKKLPNRGYATYRLVIHKNTEVNQAVYGLKLSTIFSNYKLWVNGNLIAEVGKVGKTKEISEAGFKYQDVPFIVDSANRNIEIVIQVSNYSHQRGGLHFPIYLSKYENLTADTRSMDILNLIIIGIILLIGINHLSLFWLRREDKSNLYFSIVCLVMILRNISTGDRIITYILPNLNWEILFKLDNLSGFATIPLFALFIYDLFKQDFPRKLMKSYVYVGIAISLLVIFTSANFYGKFRTIYELYVLIGGLYLTFGILLRATLRKRPHAIYTFIGMFILYSTAINDVLSSMGIIQTAYVAPYGLVIFMLLQSISINIKSARAINHNEILGVQLQHEKENLEKRIEERTGELKSQHNILPQHQEKEKLQNWINHGVTLLNEVIVQNKDDLQMLCSNVLSALIKYIDAKVGAFYVVDDNDSRQLKLIAEYGLNKETKERNTTIDTDSGLVGAAFSQNQVQLVENIPNNYLAINSGLGSASPKALLLTPLNFDKTVLGVIELASFKEITEVEIEFVKKISDIVANNINTVKMNEENIKLIQQFKVSSQQMQENEEKLRQNLEELEMIREQYEILKEDAVQKN